MLLALPASATWQLDNQNSLLNFVSVKKGSIAENHSFMLLKGEIDDKHQANIDIDLASVNTNILIRDERMKTILFNTEAFSTARFRAQLAATTLSGLAIGDTKNMTVNGVLDFHGQTQSLAINVNVIKLSSDKVVVNTNQPFFINAADFELIEGINTLKTLAGLPSINTVVPVTFSVTFVH
jgi:polyisoprenoid-binding protein YceI